MRSPLLAGVLVAAVLSACGHARTAPALPLSARAYLTPDALTIVLPLADSAATWLAAGHAFHWRLTAPGAPTLSYEIEDSVAARPTSVQVRLTQGELSRCESQGHMLLCGWRLPTTATVVNGQLVVRLRDADVLAKYAQAAPAFVTRGVWQSARRVQADSVPLVRSP
jgi:hypothetical protein